MLRWHRTRNFIIISRTISGLIAIVEILERAEVRRQVSSASGWFVHVPAATATERREEERIAAF